MTEGGVGSRVGAFLDLSPLFFLCSKRSLLCTFLEQVLRSRESRRRYSYDAYDLRLFSATAVLLRPFLVPPLRLSATPRLRLPLRPLILRLRPYRRLEPSFDRAVELAFHQTESERGSAGERDGDHRRE